MCTSNQYQYIVVWIHNIVYPMSEQVRLRWAALEGDIWTDIHSWKAQAWQMIVFVSSTFTDTTVERNILIEKILPALRKEYRKFGLDISVVDMRWGGRNAFLILNVFALIFRL
jgi:hypothetical protein